MKVEECTHLIASEQELFGAAAEKSEVTILPKASQGELREICNLHIGVAIISKVWS